MSTLNPPNKGIARAVKERKHNEAVARQEAHAKRSPKEQLALLIERGHGHCGEAIDLRVKISKAA